MSYVEAIVLAIIQGLTEFLPISSSGHLALANHLLGMGDLERNLVVTLALHLASLAAVFVIYWRRILELLTLRRRELAYLVVATIPIVVVGALFDKQIESFQGMPKLICVMMIVNGCFLFLTDQYGRGTQTLAEAPPWKVLVVGIVQAIRFPGLSRSGGTIGSAWLCGIDRSEAVKFSFLLSIPAVLGAVVWKGRKVDFAQLSLPWGPLLLALVLTFVLSLLSIRIVETLAVGKRWRFFAAYCLLAGGAGLAWFSRH
jgi:undecaprenyl-diphosphatase